MTTPPNSLSPWQRARSLVLTAPEGDGETPLPPRQFRWYILFWHVIYLGSLAITLGYHLWAHRAALGLSQAGILLLAAGQVGLYLWNFILNDRWPLPLWRHGVYFIGSLALWWIEWQVEPAFFGLGIAYLGQMFGVLPPVAALPATLVVLVLFYGQAFNWQFGGLPLNAIVGPLVGWASFAALFLFIYHTSRISRERGLLIVKLQAIQRELELAREHDNELAALRERERLARDLHDSLGHALVAISVQLEAIQRLYRVDPARAEAQVEALKGVARANMDELRRSLMGLRAPGLGDRPLVEALRSLCLETGQRIGLDAGYRLSGDPARLTPAAAEALWRVAQEALTNAAKHAQPRSLDVSLEVGPAEAVLRVRDDGRGLPPGAEALPGHYGLRGMRERVEGVGGTLRLSSEAGTLVEARVPVVG
ncbi:MAG: sensor histidine kinase [Anaerolineales bacterium]